MKNLPVGIQSLPTLVENNCVYVDKTRIIHELVTTGSYYFYSRPRRFGKSLLISTLKELYSGNRAVFKGLWIEDNWDWTKSHPIIHLSFDTVDYQHNSLADALSIELKHYAEFYDIQLKEGSHKSLFRELLRKIHAKHGRVVLLIDEYDKPIIDYLETATIEKAQINRETLRDFYSILKSADEQLRFVFITGVSKFSKVSLFSHLNNLLDISLGERFAALTGYTQEELEFYFKDHLLLAAEKQAISVDALLQEMKVWYNGYSWDGHTRLYNPFGTLNFLFNKEFRNYWFATGNPKFLVAQMQKQVFFNIENIYVDGIVFEKFDLEHIELIPLLFQTGYLTIKERDTRAFGYVLDYPNKEVRESMYQFLLSDTSENSRRVGTGRTMTDLKDAFLRRDLERVRQILNAILADLPYHAYQNQSEGFYHGLLHIVFNYLGMFVQSEVHSAHGRADAVVETSNDVFIFEFKYNKTAEEALQQLKNKGYAEKYRSSGKQITGIAFNFDAEQRTIAGWLVERL